MNAKAERLKYGSAGTAKTAETLEVSARDLGQRNPQHCPQSSAAGSAPVEEDSLGQVLNVSEAASLLGCSEWTVRQRYMPQGLPYLRASATGKLVFFQKQVIDWILKRQERQKGGLLR